MALSNEDLLKELLLPSLSLPAPPLVMQAKRLPRRTSST